MAIFLEKVKKKINDQLNPQDVLLIDATIVEKSDSVQKLVQLMENSGTSDFVVTDTNGKYCGMVTAEDLRAALVYREAIPLLQVSEIQRSDLPTISMGQQLDIVLDKFSMNDVQSLAVIGDDDQINGMITRSNLMKRYQKALDEDY